MQIQMFQIGKAERKIHLSDALAGAGRILLATIAAAIIALCSIVVPSALAAQTQPLIGNHPTVNVANMSARADAARALNLHISFAPRNPVALAKLLADLQNPASPRYHHWLSPAQFNARFGRSADEVAAVRQWLLGQGLRVIESSALGLMTTATVAQAESAFVTPIIASTDGSLYANASDPQIPAQFAGVIGSIEGLDNIHHSLALGLRPHFSSGTRAATFLEQRNPMLRAGVPMHIATLMPAAVVDYSGGLGLAFGPSDLWTFYDEASLLNGGTDGSGGDCVAIIEDTDYLSSAVSLFDTNFSLPLANVTRVQADGSSPSRTGDEVEALLDIEWAHAVAPGAAIDVYIGNPATATIDPLVDALKKAVTDNKNAARLASVTASAAPQTHFSAVHSIRFLRRPLRRVSRYSSRAATMAPRVSRSTLRELHASWARVVASVKRRPIPTSSPSAAPSSRLLMMVPTTPSAARPKACGMIPLARAVVGLARSSRSPPGRFRALRPTPSATFPISASARVQSRRAFIGATTTVAALR